ncbi:MAG: hypothetical protein ACYS0I_04835 [Planctomycetota bacterium]|jgi:hypothetical protein
MDSNHCQIVADSITGKRAVDEKTFASVSILEERLERLKKLDKAFGNVSFSPDVEQLLRRKNTITVG